MSRLDELLGTLHKKPLPDGWRRVPLCEVAELNPSRRGFTRDANAPTTFVPMAAVDAVLGIIAEPQIRHYSEVATGYTYFLEGDVLFAKITPCMQNGKHAVARDLIDGVGLASTEFHVIRPSDDILADWIHFFVRQPAVLHEATNHFTGAVGQQRVPDGFLKLLEVPLPVVPEQRRILAVLHEKMSAVTKARLAIEVQRESVEAMPGALLRAAFQGGI